MFQFPTETNFYLVRDLSHPHLTMKTQFSELSSLVLVDILAALPMEDVVRMARLCHERLRQTFSLKWVTDRMTDVTLRAVVRAFQAGVDTAKTFCTDSIKKRLNGKVVITSTDAEQPSFMNACVEIASKLPGR